MKFKNPKTGHEASRFTDMICNFYVCHSCPIDKLTQENGFSFCSDYALETAENLIRAASLLGYYPAETFRERLEREHPECTGEHFAGGCKGCPEDYGYEDEHEGCDVMTCVGCWDRIIPMKEYEEEKKMEKIKSGDIVRLKKEVIEAGTSVYNGVPISAGTIDALREKEFSVTTAWIDDAWSVKEGPLVCFIGEDALELVRHADDAEADDEPEEETEEKKMGIKEGDIVRLKKKVVEAGGGMYNDLTVTLGMVKALDGKKFEVCATGTDETWCIKTDGIMDGFIIGEDALELVKEETEEKGMEIKDSGERREYLGGLNKIGDKRGMCGTHGMSHTRIYSIWTDMKRRCYNPRNKRYSRYGERGIEVCEEWKNDFTKFYDWAVKNGYEDALTIERKDINKEYCPENCCWITFKNQQRNTSRTHWITFGGETKSLAEWSEITGLSQGLIKDRINKLHWSIEETLTIPKMKIGGKKCHK